MIRYLSGLLACGLGLLGGGWLVVVVVLLRGTSSVASLASLGTGAGVALVSAVGIACWSVAWRQRMRLDGVLATRSGPLSQVTPGATVRRSRRALRRDMRHAARAARRGPRRDQAAEPVAAAQRDAVPRRSAALQRDAVPRRSAAPRRDEAAWPDGVTRRKAAVPAGQPGGHDCRPVIPGPRSPVTAETGNGGSGGPGGPDRPRVMLTELRSLLEPLLTTGPMPALEAGFDDSAAGDLLGEEESW